MWVDNLFNLNESIREKNSLVFRGEAEFYKKLLVGFWDTYYNHCHQHQHQHHCYHVHNHQQQNNWHPYQDCSGTVACVRGLLCVGEQSKHLGRLVAINIIIIRKYKISLSLTKRWVYHHDCRVFIHLGFAVNIIKGHLIIFWHYQSWPKVGNFIITIVKLKPLLVILLTPLGPDF